MNSPQEALTHCINAIDTLVQQCPTGFRSEQNKIRFLRHVVIDESWTMLPIAKADAGEVDWHQITTDLHAAISLLQERKQSMPEKHTKLLQRWRKLSILAWQDMQEIQDSLESTTLTLRQIAERKKAKPSLLRKL